MSNESNPRISDLVRYDESSPEVVPRITDGQDTSGRPLVGLEFPPKDHPGVVRVSPGHIAFKAAELDRPVEPRE